MEFTGWLIYSTDPLKRCYALCHAVQTGISEIISNFRYMTKFKILTNTFIVRHGSSEHFCYLNNDQKTITCCDSYTNVFINESRQLPWDSVEGVFKIVQCTVLLLDV